MPEKKKSFYLTTTLPYVNAKPHLGHALEFVKADIITRYKRLLGFDVFFNTGTDEHGLKIYRKALELNKNPQDYVDEYAESFKKFCKTLDIKYDNFIRTTDKHHIEAAQEFWKRCQVSNDIYKKTYKVKYCVGCELEKTDSELVDGKCPEHPNLELEIIEEENYFFKFSNYQKPLLDFYKKNPDFVVPDFRFNEIKKFVERGLEDFSISRLKEKMPWGVDVPGDPDHVMYVWFDALVNYIAAIGWPKDTKKFEQYWGTKENTNALQIAGKDNIRQQAAMWQAMLMSAGIEPSKQIIINGFILGEGGVKMSKSLGNVVDPLEIVEEYGVDALRFYLARHVNSFEDSEFFMAKFKEAYNADLANGLGNLVSRIMKMATTYSIKLDPLNVVSKQSVFLNKNYNDKMNVFDIKATCDHIWSLIQYDDLRIQKEQPFKLLNSSDQADRGKGESEIQFLLADLRHIAIMLEPVIPQTSLGIQELVMKCKMPEKPLFPRKD